MLNAVDVEGLIVVYERLLKRAFKVVGGPPFWADFDEETARLAISNNIISLSWADVDHGYYDDTSLGIRTAEFPVELLIASDEAIDVWKRAEEQKHQEQETRNAEQAHANREMEERSDLARLKAKYERS